MAELINQIKDTLGQLEAQVAQKDAALENLSMVSCSWQGKGKTGGGSSCIPYAMRWHRRMPLLTTSMVSCSWQGKGKTS